MKKIYTYLTVVISFSLMSFTAFSEVSDTTQVSSDEELFRKEMVPLNTVLMEWDMVRGEWMAENLVNMAYKRPLTPKPFTENFTLAELVDFLPKSDKERIQTIISTRTAAGSTGSPVRNETADQWRVMQRTFGAVGCNPRSGRTYGDPHINTLDGKSYSFQTVGEFVLSKSRTSSFEVQTRQKASTASVSLNIGAAMNVNGDRVAFYTNEYPDANIYEPVRVNGQVVRIKATAETLNNGGVIRRTSGNNYVVVWPSGEKVMVSIRNSGRFPFMNVSVEVPSCSTNEYFGLLGNANGNSRDDLTIDSRDMANIGFSTDLDAVFNGRVSRDQRDLERQSQQFISTQFANAYRINMLTSLFDYGVGQSTQTFTNLNFPSQFQSITDLNDRERNRARRRCEEQGIRGEDLRGCVFDMAFVNVGPTPRRQIPRATTGQTLSTITPGTTTNPRDSGTNPNGNWDGDNNTTGGTTSAEGKTPNTNVNQERETVAPATSTSTQKPAGVATGQKPVTNKPAVVKPSTNSRPATNTSSRPATTTSKPKPVVKPSSRTNRTISKPRGTSTKSSGSISRPKTGTKSTKSSGTISRPSGSTKPSGTKSTGGISRGSIGRGGR